MEEGVWVDSLWDPLSVILHRFWSFFNPKSFGSWVVPQTPLGELTVLSYHRCRNRGGGGGEGGGGGGNGTLQ